MSLLNNFAEKGASGLKVSFTFSPKYPLAGQPVQFVDTSTGNPGSWQWDFGDGSGSTEKNPIHAYSTAGFRKITLLAAAGTKSKKSTKTLTVMPASLQATFAFSPTTPGPGQTVQFADTTAGDPTSWHWDFGDGTTSTAKNPSHVFVKAGSYIVSLTARNSSGSKQVSKTITVTSMSIVTASFAYSPASPAAGQSVQFTDTSTGSPTAWQWDFNDGATSTAQNPSHIFASSGSYGIMLTVSNSSGSTYVTQIINVLPASTLNASFTYSPASPVMGESIQFTDMSAGNPTSWQWSFGDGATSTAKDPIHSYATAGSKIVTLEITNGTGSSRGSRTVTVVVQSAIIVNHSSIRLDRIPTAWIDQAKQKLHIAYGHTSHGSQISTGMAGLVAWKGATYSFSSGGAGGALDVRDYYGNFGGLGVASDLGNPNRTAWESATRTYLNQNPAINVIIWSWCGQVDGTEADIQLYLSLMSGLEHDFPNVKFVYMTGHTDGAALTGNVPTRNKQIRDYCLANNKILYDFADIESYNPDGTYFGDKLVNDACDYDSNGDGIRDRNWAIDWQNANPGKWYQCESAHSQPLNANMKAYAAWHLWARLAGWDGN